MLADPLTVRSIAAATLSKAATMHTPTCSTVVGALLVAGVFARPEPVYAQHLPMAEPESVGMSSERLARLSAYTQRYIEDNLVAGTVTLVARRGKVVHYEAQGQRWIKGNDPMDVDDIFVIMSMTKPIVSTALMMLWEEGHFLLDDPISKWIPEYENMTVLEERDGVVRRVPADRPITVRHVLTHTAGVDPQSKHLTEEERALLRPRATVEESLIARAALPLRFHPGDEWHYGSSTNHVALLVERISGQPLKGFLQERILRPLGMRDTHYYVPANKEDRVTAAYSPSGPGGTIEPRFPPRWSEQGTYFGGTAGLSSTAADYFRFSQMILNGGELDGVRILAPTTVNLMTANHTGDKHIYIKGPDNGYGFGLSFSMVTDVAMTRQGITPGSFGWGGAWGTVFWIDPVEEVVSIFMTQITSYSHFNLRWGFPNLVMQAITESSYAGDAPIRGYERIRR